MANAPKRLQVLGKLGGGVDVTAKPGQMILVKEVDENGQPTAWEAVDRTHWVEYGGMTELIPEATITPDDDGMFAIPTEVPNLAVGAPYTVNWNGAEYNCVAQEYTEDGMSANVIGNFGAIAGGTDTGEPFVIMRLLDEFAALQGFYAIIFVLDGSASVTLSICGSVGEIVHKLPGKFLPDGLPYIEGEGTRTQVLASTNLTGLSSDGVGVSYIPLAADTTYFVNWNGTEYKCVSRTFDSGCVIGNCGWMFGTGNGEPFGIASVTDGTASQTLVISNDGSTEATVYIHKDASVIHKIDERFLPDDIGGLPEVTTENNGQTVIVADGKWSVGKLSYTNLADKPIPDATTASNGAFLRVVNGSWVAAALPNAEDGEF